MYLRFDTIKPTRQPTGQRLCKVRTQHFFLIGTFLFLYYEESGIIKSEFKTIPSTHPNALASGN